MIHNLYIITAPSLHSEPETYPAKLSPTPNAIDVFIMTFEYARKGIVLVIEGNKIP